MPVWPVTALYVDATGPYRDLVAEVYDEVRDARTYPGPMPVVAHPPCGPWGRYRHRCDQDRSLAIYAVWQVRKWGGVLEHPVGSRLFREMNIPTTPWDDPAEGRETDEWGGYTIKRPQFHWGHRSEKSTILYIVGTEEIPPLPERIEGPDLVPVERLGHRERRMTPPAMAWWLCSLASRCRRT